MATLLLGEHLIDAAIAKLRAGLASRIATINVEKTDFDITAPSTDDFYAYGSVLIPRVPAVIVTHGDDAQFAEEGPHSLSLNWSLAIAFVDQDPDRASLGRRLDRLHRAIIETLWDDDPKEKLAHPSGGANPAAAYSITPDRFIPGRVARVSDDDETEAVFRSLAIQTFRCWRVEE